MISDPDSKPFSQGPKYLRAKTNHLELCPVLMLDPRNHQLNKQLFVPVNSGVIGDAATVIGKIIFIVEFLRLLEVNRHGLSLNLYPSGPSLSYLQGIQLKFLLVCFLTADGQSKTLTP